MLGAENNNTTINRGGYTLLPMLFAEGVESFGGVDPLPGKILTGG